MKIMRCSVCGVKFEDYKENVDRAGKYNALLTDSVKNNMYGGKYRFTGRYADDTDEMHGCTDLGGCRFPQHTFALLDDDDVSDPVVVDEPEVTVGIDENGDCPYCIKARKEYAEGKQVPLICVDNVTLVGCSRHVFEAARKMVTGGKKE